MFTRKRGSIAMLLLFTLHGLCGCAQKKTGKNEFDFVFRLAERQYTDMLAISRDLHQYPRTSNPDGSVHYDTVDDWTGGFWPGCLWNVYQFTKKEQWKKAAIQWTESLENNQYNTRHHDIGFMMYSSYGNAMKFAPQASYRKILVQSAKSLITRYNPVVKSIKSWNYRKSWDCRTEWFFPVIIDNMMNLELLFYASKVTGDPVYRKVAIDHAETTMKYHIRKDYSSYHVVDYDTTTGKMLHQQTCQGFADNSTWARGQAWGIYGFTLMYRETKDKRYLITAKKMADFFMHHPNLPEDKIPYWDFNIGQPGYKADWNYNPADFKYTPRDASAAAITAAALLEMQGYLGRDGAPYKNFAIAILRSLSSPAYLAAPGTNSHFLLKHSVGSIPHGNEVDVPLVYADYYFLEALLRFKNMR